MTAGLPFEAYVRRRSVIELGARGRAFALLDDGSAKELCGPFDRIESPWLAAQGLVPQSDDGMVVIKGTLAGHACLVVAVEGAFHGGGVGEVGGAKASTALSLAAADTAGGRTTPAVLFLDSGGVRLQEGTLGLNAIAEICDALLALRPQAPVIGVVAGPVGAFGGMGIVAGLCTRLVVTREARIGLNGPEAIEAEAGVEEFDSCDRALVWAVAGGAQRYGTGLADALVSDSIDDVRDAVITAIAAGVPARHRSEQLDTLHARLDGLVDIDPADLPARWGTRFGELPPLDVAPARWSPAEAT
jgi:malonate decarboxylase beta subunit